MVSLLQTDRVKYLISEEKGEYESLAKLYFCIFCLKIRSTDDLQHEIESHFCPQTMDSWTTNDVATSARKNKSSNSWHCPSCSQSLTLGIYNTNTPVPGEPEKMMARKTYFQSCGFCRWTSREVGIPDKEFSSMSWSEKLNPNQQRVNSLVEYFKYLSHKEALDKKSLAKIPPHLAVTRQMQHRYSKAVHSPSFGRQLKENMSLKKVTIEPAKTISIDEVEKLPEGIFTDEVTITKMTGIEQRHGSPTNQPNDTSELAPYSMIAFIKRSLRCKACDHNLIKAEYNPASTKFKIHLIALKFIPEIRMNKPLKNLQAGQRSCVELSIINPTEHLIHVSLSDCSPAPPYVNSSIELPKDEIVIARLDETAEFTQSDDPLDSEIGQDNPEVIIHRDGNRIVFLCYVTPNKDMKIGDRVITCLKFTHEHHENSVIVSRPQQQQQQSKATTPHQLTQTVVMDIGAITTQ